MNFMVSRGLENLLTVNCFGFRKHIIITILLGYLSISILINRETEYISNKNTYIR